MCLSTLRGRRGRRTIPPRCLKISHWNIEGVISGTYGNKLEDPDFIETIRGDDLIALSETHYGLNKELRLAGYVIKKKARPKSKKAKKFSGGVALAIRENLAGAIEILSSKSDNIMWVRIKCQNSDKDFMLGIVYISPINSSYTKNVLINQFRTWEILTDEIAKYKTHFRVGLIGDFNARTGQLSDLVSNDDVRFTDLPDDYTVDLDIIERKNCDETVNTFGKRLIELCQMSGLRIVNGRKLGDSVGKRTCFEWNGSSTVDYMLMDESSFSLVQTFKVQDKLNHLSDHCPISAVINLDICREISKHSNKKGLRAPKKPKWDSLMDEVFRTKLSNQATQDELDNICKASINSGEQCEEVLMKMNNILREAANVKLSSNRISKKSKRKKTIRKNPWYSDELTILKSQLKTAGEKLLKNYNDSNLRQSFYKLKKRYKAAVKCKRRQYKQDLYNRLENLSEENPKEYWTLFEKLKNCHNYNENEECPIDDKDWIKHYTKLFGPRQYDKDRIDEINREINELIELNDSSLLNVPISPEEINEASKYLKNNKAVGLDQISNEMIKCAIPFILSALKRLFNSILWNHYYPEDWKKGAIVNLYKAGDVHDPNNYRGLTINSCLGKLFNTILNNRFVKFLESNKIICDNQIGFKKKARTSDHIFIINTIFKKICRSNQKLYLCFVDFQKAYDSVWRNALMLKLLRSGVRGNFFEIIRHMYTDCNACIRSEGLLSDNFKCVTGVRQGDVLSPNLFNLYINDLPDIFDKCVDSPKLDNELIHCLLYADDLVLLSLSAKGLQDKLDKLDEYCKFWCLDINVKKTKVMAMAKTKIDVKLITEQMKIGEIKLDWVNFYKYLGIEIHADGNFVNTSKNLCIRGWKASFKIKAACKNIDVNPDLRLKFFDTLVKPIICYNSEIWGLANNLFNSKSIDQFWKRLDDLSVEKFQLKFCKGVLGVGPKSSNAAVRGELGRFPITIFIVSTALKFLKHLDEVKADRPLLNAAIKEDAALCTSKSWIKKLENVLRLFKSPTINNAGINKCMLYMKKKMKEEYINYWTKFIKKSDNDGGKLDLYSKLKQNFAMEPYLQHIKQFKLRRAMTVFRISAHKLEIETGRYVKSKAKGRYVPRDERICALCQENNDFVRGDEEHALTTCPSFERERTKLFKYFDEKIPSFKHLDNFNKTLYMLSCEGLMSKRVSKFMLCIQSSQRPNFYNLWKKLNNINE